MVVVCRISAWDQGFDFFKKKKLLTEGDKIRGGVTALCHDEDISVFGRAQVSFGVFTHSQNVPIQLWRRWKYYLHQKFFYHKILFTDFSGTAINCKLEYSSWPTFLKFQYVSIIGFEIYWFEEPFQLFLLKRLQIAWRSSFILITFPRLVAWVPCFVPQLWLRKKYTIFGLYLLISFFYLPFVEFY